MCAAVFFLRWLVYAEASAETELMKRACAFASFAKAINAFYPSTSDD